MKYTFQVRMSWLIALRKIAENASTHRMSLNHVFFESNGTDVVGWASDGSMMLVLNGSMGGIPLGAESRGRQLQVAIPLMMTDPMLNQWFHNRKTFVEVSIDEDRISIEVSHDNLGTIISCVAPKLPSMPDWRQSLRFAQQSLVHLRSLAISPWRVGIFKEIAELMYGPADNEKQNQPHPVVVKFKKADPVTHSPYAVLVNGHPEFVGFLMPLCQGMAEASVPEWIHEWMGRPQARAIPWVEPSASDDDITLIREQ